MVQRGHAFAIVDEVDSILIDEARTPLIISGQGEQVHRAVRQADRFAARPQVPDVRGDRREGGAGRDIEARLHRRREGEDRHPHASGHEEGRGVLRARQPLRTRRTPPLQHHINQAIKAHGVMQRDVDYVVKRRRGHHRRRVHRPSHVRPPLQRGSASGHRGQGGRQGRSTRARPSRPSPSRTTSASTASSSGMTGTAHDRGGRVPRHLSSWTSSRSRPTSRCIRKDNPDVVYKTERGKFNAVIDAASRHATKRASRCWSVRSRSRSPSSCPSSCKAQGIKHDRAERQAPRARGRNRRAGRQVRAPSPSPPTWPAAVPISCSAATPSTLAQDDLQARPHQLAESKVQSAEADRLTARRDRSEEIHARPRPGILLYAELDERQATRRRSTQRRKRCARPAACISSARSAMNPAVSTTSCAAVPAVRATPARSSFYISLEDDLMRLFGSASAFRT